MGEGARGLDGLFGLLLGVSPRAVGRARLRAVAARADEDRLVLGVAGPGGLRFDVEITPRDDAAAAYTRTAHLNLAWRGDRPLAATARLLDRLADRQATARFEALREAFARCVPPGPVDPAAAGAPGGTRAPVVAPTSTAASAAPTSAAPSPPRPPGAFPVDSSLHIALSGDVPCGMMGSVAVIDGAPIDVAFLIHGDNSCTPPPEPSGLRVYSTGMTDIDVVAGGRERLVEAARWIASSRHRPAALVLLGTCLSEMIGEDLPHLAAAAERETGMPVIGLPTDGLKALRPAEVAARLHGALAERFVLPSREQARGVGLVGYVDPGAGLLPELQGLLARAGMALRGLWPQGGLSGLSGLASARHVMAPERMVYWPLLDRLASRCGARIVEHRVPYGLAGSTSFFRRLGELGGCVEAMEAAMDPPRRRAEERLARFRSRCGGARVAVGLGNNRKATAGSTTVHLSLGAVPLLVEAGLEPVLVAILDPTEANVREVAAIAAALGASPEVHLHADPPGAEPILRALRPSLAINEYPHKLFIDRAGVPFVGARSLEPGFGGLCRTLDVLEASLL